jgi:hypothetical protein
VLSGRELAGLGNLPSLVFFNACEAGRIRKGVTKNHGVKVNILERVERSVGRAEAFLRGGIANYVGTYWPVGDEPASVFAGTFYRELLKGMTIGPPARSARNRKTRFDRLGGLSALWGFSFSLNLFLTSQKNFQGAFTLPDWTVERTPGSSTYRMPRLHRGQNIRDLPPVNPVSRRSRMVSPSVIIPLSEPF